MWLNRLWSLLSPGYKIALEKHGTVNPHTVGATGGQVFHSLRELYACSHIIEQILEGAKTTCTEVLLDKQIR